MTSVVEKIEQYLSNGGLFNPELMDHQAVRDMIIEARDVISDMVREKNDAEKWVKIPTEENEAVLMVIMGMSYLKTNAPHRLKEF
jgi:hypothetical protein